MEAEAEADDNTPDVPAIDGETPQISKKQAKKDAKKARKKELKLKNRTYSELLELEAKRERTKEN